MSNDTTTRWTASVSKDTDIAARSFLAQRRMLDETLAEARGKFADLSPQALDALLDEAVAAARQADVPKAR